MYMIDWLTLRLWIPHILPIQGGLIQSFDKHGALVYQVSKHVHIKGSFDNSVAVKSINFNAHQKIGTIIEISGNPIKFLQGHNLIGSLNIVGLGLTMINRIFKILNQETGQELDTMNIREIKITRLDIARVFTINPPELIKEFLIQASKTAIMEYRGRGILQDQTLYHGKKSKRYSHKFYNKALEMTQNKSMGGLPQEAQDRLLSAAYGCLRSELVFRSMELKKLGLVYLKDFIDVDLKALYNQYYSRLNIPENIMSKTAVKTFELPRALRNTYELWRRGVDVREMMAKATFYLHRRKILELTGMDISAPPAQGWENEENEEPQAVIVKLNDFDPTSIKDLVFEPSNDVYHKFQRALA